MNTPKSIPLLRLSCALGMGLMASIGATRAHAELLAYEGFEYTRGLFGADLLGKGTANDQWGDKWVDSDTRNATPSSSPILEGSLSYTDTHGNVLETKGNRVEVSGTTTANNTIGRNLANPIIPEAGKVLYLSFMGQRKGEAANPDDTTLYPDGYSYGDNLYPRAAGVRLLSSASNNNLNALIGNPSNKQSNRWRFTSESVEMISGTEFTTESFVVVKIVYTDEGVDESSNPLVGTTVSMWVNPSDLGQELSAEALTETILKDGGPYALVVNAIGIEGNDASSNRPLSKIAVDEIRVGTTWADVTPHTTGSGSTTWAGLPVSEDGWVVTDANYFGWLNVVKKPWVFSYDLGTYVYFPESYYSADGAWAYFYDWKDVYRDKGNWFWMGRMITYGFIPSYTEGQTSGWAYILNIEL